MSDLINLPNIGVVLEKKLLLAGIENQEKLKKSGVKEEKGLYANLCS